MSNIEMITQAFHYIYNWQTLIAGLLAVFAGWLTVHGTRSAAKLQIKAMKENAEAQIAAARAESDKEVRLRKEAEKAYLYNTSKITLSMFDSLDQTVRSRLSQFSHGDPGGELSGPGLNEIRDIAVPDAGKFRANIALLSPHAIPRFDKLLRELQVFSSSVGKTHVGPLKGALDGYLEEIRLLRSQIEPVADSSSRQP